MSHWLVEKLKSVETKSSISDYSGDYCYGDLVQEIESQINNFQQIPAKSTVAINADYSFSSVALLLALTVKKCIIVPITTKITEEVETRLNESLADYNLHIYNEKWNIRCLNRSESHPFIDNLRKKNHSGLVLFSSGSTGKPKAMIHDFDQLIDSYKDRKLKSIPFLVFLMFDHIGGVNTMLNALSMGAHLVLPENRDSSHVCELIEKYKVKVLPASPSFLNLLLISEAHKRYDLSSLRMITYGTESMPDSLLHKIKKNFPRARLLQTFGTSETGIARTSSQASDSTFFKIDDPNVKYKIVDNELWLKSGTQVLGYLNVDDQSFDSDGWFQTGDLVEQVDDGYMRIIGRNKEIINVGGEKVLPSEVENVLGEMDEVSDSIVYGQANAITGQNVAADIVCNGDYDPKEIKKKIRSYCKQKLEQYKIPARINFVDGLKLGANFKKIRRK